MSFGDSAKRYVKNQLKFLKGQMITARKEFDSLEESYYRLLSDRKVIITPVFAKIKEDEISKAHMNWVRACDRYYTFLRNYPDIVGELILKGQINV